MKEISPGSPEFAEVKARFERLMDAASEDVVIREKLTEDSFRQFCATILTRVAEQMGYIIHNATEFVRDMKWAASEGWRQGVTKARENRLRPRA